MIPAQQEGLIDLEVVEQPSKTYRIDTTAGTVNGVIDGIEAIKQAVQKIFYTERYAYVIYSSQYGTELEQKIGQDFDFVKSDLERTFMEALMVDDRILGITNFRITDASKDSLQVSFTVLSTAGSIEISTGVQII